MNEIIYQHLKFRRSKNRWIVRNVKTNAHLGDIRWNADWNKFAFYPRPRTYYSSDCEMELAVFQMHLLRGDFDDPRIIKQEYKVGV